MPYAQDTTVPVERSKSEIERLLTRYKASQFVTGWDEKTNRAMVQFVMGNRLIRIMITTPTAESFLKVKRHDAWGKLHERDRTESQMQNERDKELKRRWRALLLVIKAKLEAVDSGISTFEEEFMPYVVTASGKTIGELILPRLDRVADSGKLPPLLPGHQED